MSQHNIRLFVRDSLSAKQSLELDAQQSHHLATVMRRKEGDSLHLFNGRDGEWSAQIHAIKRQQVSLRVSQLRLEQVPSNDLRLLLPPLKKERLGIAVEKATELGVSQILCTKTELSQASAIKTERLELIAISASEQCERMSIPEIDPIKSLRERLDAWPEQVKILVCTERNHRSKQRRALLPLLMQTQDQPLAFAIGPEGGWSNAELELMSAYPMVRFVSLGTMVLRAETAVITALSAWNIVRASLDPLYN